jgi:hypothetical protein
MKVIALLLLVVSVTACSGPSSDANCKLEEQEQSGSDCQFSESCTDAGVYVVHCSAAGCTCVGNGNTTTIPVTTCTADNLFSACGFPGG